MKAKSSSRLKHLIESQQLNPPIISGLFKDADDLRERNLEQIIKEKLLEGRGLATLFYEPSTRTRFSFESAMLKLGGYVITSENARQFSSAVKGETVEDTIRIVSSYADCIVLRHYEDGAAKKAASVSTVPIINA